MPLSEHEQRLLEQMERALSAEDPKLVSALTGTRLARPTRGRLLLALALVVAGIVILLGGLIAKITLVGVFGFALALAGTYLAITRTSNTKPKNQSGRPGRQAGRPGFFGRLEERWDRREE